MEACSLPVDHWNGNTGIKVRTLEARASTDTRIQGYKDGGQQGKRSRDAQQGTTTLQDSDEPDAVGDGQSADHGRSLAPCLDSMNAPAIVDEHRELTTADSSLSPALLLDTA